MASPVSVVLPGGDTVSGLLDQPASPRACYVLAHGAGAGMQHPFMVAVAAGLAERGIATLRYQFPYMEHGSKRPDSPKVAQAVVRAAVARATELLPGVPLFAGGKSFGGRMSSQAQAASALPGVKGLAFLGFPLHAPGKPSSERGEHLLEIRVPLLFLQGTRDDFAQAGLLQPLVKRLGRLATWVTLDEADHSFHVPKRTGRKDSEVLAQALDALVAWVSEVLAR